MQLANIGDERFVFAPLGTQEMCLTADINQKRLWRGYLTTELQDLKDAYKDLLYGGGDHSSSGTVFRSRTDAEIFFSGNSHQKCYR